MKMPFTIEEFLNVFEKYNNSVWPLQLLFYLLALAAVAGILKRVNGSDKIVSLILSFLWLWMGIVYHLFFFTRINKAAWLFGTLFILQGLLFLFYGMYRNKLSFTFRFDVQGITGIILMVYALLIYPVIGYILNHEYPRSPTFGLPCPTTIFTFGLLLWTSKKCGLPILIIPFLWSLIGISAAVQLSIYEDFGLLASALATAFLIGRKSGLLQKEEISNGNLEQELNINTKPPSR